MKPLIFLCLLVLGAHAGTPVAPWKEVQRERLAEISEASGRERHSRLHGMLLELHAPDAAVPGSDREEIRREVSREMLSGPGYGEFYENELKALSPAYEAVFQEPAREIEGDGSVRISGETGLAMIRLFDILEGLPGPETVRLLGTLLPDWIYFRFKGEFHESGFSPSQRAGEILAVLPLADAPVYPGASQARRRGMILFSPEKWKEWYEEVKDGRRSFAFRGQPVSYRLLGNGSFQESPRDPSGDDIRMFLGGADPVMGEFDAGSLLKVVPLKQVPRHLSYERGALSLVPDAGDERDGLMVIYLINDTEQPIRKVVGWHQIISSEVLAGGRWYGREWMQPGCGSVPDPTDLPPGHALALSTTAASEGDTGGTIRYRLSQPGLKVFSQPMRGRYDLATYEELREQRHRDVVKGPWNVRWESVEDNWNGTSVARTPEEFIALLELCRYEGSLRGKDLLNLQRWARWHLSDADLDDGQRNFCLHLEEVLTKPWLVEQDPVQLFDRGVRALEYDGEAHYGTPERCRALTLRYLLERTRWLREADHLENRPSLPEDALARLERCLQDLLKSDDPAVKIAAAEMIAHGPVRIGGAGIFRGMLAEARESAVVVPALGGLAMRGESREALAWLAGHPDFPGLDVASCQAVISPHLRGERSGEEEMVIRRILESQPLELPVAISRREKLPDSTPFPEEDLPVLRKFLWGEMGMERKEEWSAEDPGKIKYVADGRTPAWKLSECLMMLASFGKEEDIALLREALDHPAATVDHPATTLYFPVRESAAAALKKRGVAVPAGLVTRLELKPGSSSERETPSMKDWVVDAWWYSGRAERVLVMLGPSGLLVSGICLVLFVRRNRRRTPTESVTLQGDVPEIAGGRSDVEYRGDTR